MLIGRREELSRRVAQDLAKDILGCTPALWIPSFGQTLWKCLRAAELNQDLKPTVRTKWSACYRWLGIVRTRLDAERAAESAESLDDKRHTLSPRGAHRCYTDLAIRLLQSV